LPLSAIADVVWDALIVGSGPAGSMAAVELARYGHRVLLVDRHWFPRPKVCGDGLTPAALRVLRRVGLEQAVREAGHVSRLLTVFSPSRIRIDLPGEYVTLRRESLDDLLARRAAAAGATFVQGTAEKVLFERDGQATIRFREGGRSLTARCCLLATGSRVTLARQVGLVPDGLFSGAAMRCYVQSDFPLKSLIVSCDRSILPGYAWIFPVAEDLFNVGCGVSLPQGARPRIDLRRFFRQFLDQFPVARDLLAHGRIAGSLQGGTLRSGWQQAGTVTVGSLLGVGEVIGTTSPYTGEGIGKALQCGELAGRLVHRALEEGDPGCLRNYPGCLENLTGLRYGQFHRVLKWIRYPWLNDFLARRVNRNPKVKEVLAALLQENTNPAQVFSWRGVVDLLRR
jgi:geranylgeranyl reductase family protein